MRSLTLGLIVTMLVATTASAKPAIRDVRELDEGLYTVGLANEIRKKCPKISGRLVKGMTELRRLHTRAIQLGYSEDEIRAHVKSDVEKDRLRARAAKYMKSQGLKQNKEGYCALGQLELKKKSGVGALLRAKN